MGIGHHMHGNKLLRTFTTQMEAPQTKSNE
jgi:hypothetical protein